MANLKNFSLRTVERIMSIFSLSLLEAYNGGYRISVIVADLCVIRVDQPSLFEKAKSGKLSFADVESYLGLTKLEADAMRLHSLRHWWMFFTLPELPAHTNWAPFNSTLFHYNLERDRAVVYFANNVIDRFTVAT